jgi:Tfp pilus assembly protein PilV
MTSIGRTHDSLCAMHQRPGVSLVEVLVAAVLLAVGIGGTLSSLAATSRLRDWARQRERLAAEALDRLAWFEARACAQSDTMERLTTADRLTLDWAVRDSVGRRLLRFGAASAGRPPQRLTLHSSWRCE